MKKRLKWLLVGSLMCIGVGSVFHHGYGMKNDEEIVDEIEFDNSYEDKECSWKQKALKSGASEVELKKVKKKFFTYQQIVKGNECWYKFNEIKDLNDVANEEKLTFLKDAADKGIERVIWHLLDAYRFGRYGLQVNDPDGLKLAIKYADQGSEWAISHLLNACHIGRYRFQVNDPEGLKLAIKYADLGSEEAIDLLLKAHLFGKYGLQENDPEGLVLAQKYADLDSEEAIKHLFNGYRLDLYGLKANNSQGLVLAEKYAKKGSVAAKRFLDENK